jgi:hypothetical protein
LGTIGPEEIWQVLAIGDQHMAWSQLHVFMAASEHFKPLYPHSSIEPHGCHKKDTIGSQHPKSAKMISGAPSVLIRRRHYQYSRA